MQDVSQGIISIESLFNYVRERTLRHAKQLGVEQEPYLISKITAPLSTLTISAAELDCLINRVLVLTENPLLGRLLETGIQTATLARGTTWVKNIDLALSDAKMRFDYDAVYIDIDNNWERKKEFILLVRHQYPVVPFVLIGSRYSFLQGLTDEERERFSPYFFFDTATPISQAAIFISDTLRKVEWDIRTRYGEIDNR